MISSPEEFNSIKNQWSLSTDRITVFTIQKQQTENQILFQDPIQDSTLYLLVQLLSPLQSVMVPQFFMVSHDLDTFDQSSPVIL